MRGSFYTSREFIIPKGAQKVSDKLSDAVAYLYPSDSARSRGKPALLVFYGQQSKPVARFYYLTEAEREAAVRKWFGARQQHAANIARHKAERSTAVATKRFEVGKTYYDRSSCDWDTIYSFTIVGADREAADDPRAGQNLQARHLRL
jgi:ABC-type phosphonate transport system ATPase subunit